MIPRAATPRVGRERVGVALQRGQILKRIHALQLAGVNQAHEEIADARAVRRLIKEHVFSVKDRFLQASLDDVVVERRTGLAQKQELGSWT